MARLDVANCNTQLHLQITDDDPSGSDIEVQQSLRWYFVRSIAASTAKYWSAPQNNHIFSFSPPELSLYKHHDKLISLGNCSGV